MVKKIQFFFHLRKTSKSIEKMFLILFRCFWHPFHAMGPPTVLEKSGETPLFWYFLPFSHTFSISCVDRDHFPTDTLGVSQMCFYVHFSNSTCYNGSSGSPTGPPHGHRPCPPWDQKWPKNGQKIEIFFSAQKPSKTISKPFWTNFKWFFDEFWIFLFFFKPNINDFFFGVNNIWVGLLLF